MVDFAGKSLPRIPARLDSSLWSAFLYALIRTAVSARSLNATSLRQQ